MTVKELVRLIIKSAVETGTPFAFNRDIVNRANPNSHKGMIYCSNLCTEIAQNMSPMETVSQTVETEDGDSVVVTRVRPGDFVVCNLASLSLGNIPFRLLARRARMILCWISRFSGSARLSMWKYLGIRHQIDPFMEKWKLCQVVCLFPAGLFQILFILKPYLYRQSHGILFIHYEHILHILSFLIMALS